MSYTYEIDILGPDLKNRRGDTNTFPTRQNGARSKDGPVSTSGPALTHGAEPHVIARNAALLAMTVGTFRQGQNTSRRRPATPDTR